MNMNMNNVAAITYRGSAVENQHIAHIAVVDATGWILRAFGDPRRVTLARSIISHCCTPSLPMLPTPARMPRWAAYTTQ